MAKAKFKPALAVVHVYEGGYSNHPSDPGGVTLEGVIQRVYDGYRKRAGKPQRRLTREMIGDPEWIEERNDIYRRQYWNAVHGDALPAGVDLVMFDGAVNSGPSQATKWLQRALGVKPDGDFGEATLDAVRSHPDHDALCAEICRRRLGMLQALKTWPTFGNGWSKRVANVQRKGQAWATGSVGPSPIPVHEEGGAGKGSVADVALPPVGEEAGVQGGAGGTSIAVGVEVAKKNLEPLVGTSKWLDTVYAVLIVAGLLAGLGGAAYWWWAKRRRKKAERAWSGEATAEVDPLLAGAPAPEAAA